MSHVIRLLTTACGIPTQHDDRYVVDYEPASMNATGEYEHDGRLVTSPDLDRAMRFADLSEAWEYARRSKGQRPDGLPNRPLSAWHKAFLTEEQARTQEASSA